MRSYKIVAHLTGGDVLLRQGVCISRFLGIGLCTRHGEGSALDKPHSHVLVHVVRRSVSTALRWYSEAVCDSTPLLGTIAAP